MSSLAPAPEIRVTGVDPQTAQIIQEKLRKEISSQEHWTWEPLCLGGSEREFYRVRHSEGKSWVVMRYTESREENKLYADIAGFLKKIRVHVPQLLFHDPQSRWIGLEDLGDLSLHTIFHESTNPEKISHYYQLAMDQIFLLHQQEQAPVKTMPGFDVKLYQWERNYFLDHFIRAWARHEIPPSDLELVEKEGENLGKELASLSRCLVHRDFQSQNIMIHDEAVWLIDFQGMRTGHATYDLASLLYDPYVSLTSDQRILFLNHYLENYRNGPPEKSFEKHFYQSSVQRLMQALGAYGFLGLIKGKKHFLRHIPAGIRNLLDALDHLQGMPATKKLLMEIQKKAVQIS